EAGRNDYALRAKAADPAPSPEPPVSQPQQPQAPVAQQPEGDRSTQNTPESVSTPTSVSEPKPKPGDGTIPSDHDLPADTSTTGRVAVGGSATGGIQYSGDHDWFAVTLEAGKSYGISRLGASDGLWVVPSYGTLGNTKIRGAVHDDKGALIPGTEYHGMPWNHWLTMSEMKFTPDEDGTYYISVSNGGRWTRVEPATYTVFVREIVDDFTAGTDTTGTVAVGGSATGAIEFRTDRDWFAVTLEEGKTYRFDLKGYATGDGTLTDPYLRGIHDAEGDLIEGTTDDDSGGGIYFDGILIRTNARVEYTATEDGTYYVSAGGNEIGIGTYTLSVSEADAM
ncbi:MAG: hypothetical protein F4213_21980, partial [Boseongicola sp. SB0677_bin_26]|nr:hypothetical protein [Boseongicola sp. SB0677_bin_26]